MCLTNPKHCPQKQHQHNGSQCLHQPTGSTNANTLSPQTTTPNTPPYPHLAHEQAALAALGAERAEPAARHAEERGERVAAPVGLGQLGVEDVLGLGKLGFEHSQEQVHLHGVEGIHGGGGNVRNVSW